MVLVVLALVFVLLGVLVFFLVAVVACHSFSYHCNRPQVCKNQHLDHQDHPCNRYQLPLCIIDRLGVAALPAASPTET